MYAIIRTGGKQYRVEEGRTVTVERLPAEEGAAVELDNVLLIEDDGQVTVGSPTIEGARVLTEVESHGRDKKIIVFKYRAKVRTRKKTGHRQHFTRLAVTEILRPGQESKIAKPKRAPRRKTAAQTGKAAAKPAEEAVAETPVEAAAKATAAKATKPGAAAKAAPKTAARKPAAAKAKAETPTEKTARKPAAAKAKAKTPTAKTAAPKRKTTRKKKDGDAAETPKANASAKSTTAGEAEKKPARRRKATPPDAAGQDTKDEE